jgi:hypothetical protein
LKKSSILQSKGDLNFCYENFFNNNMQKIKFVIVDNYEPVHQ